MTNEQDMVDYFGNEEDIAVFKIEESMDSDITSAFVDVEQKDTTVDGIIDEIILVNENQQVFQKGMQTYDVWLTRGNIFMVSGREISFEKQVVHFSEEINIQIGYNLVETYGDIKEFSEEWPDSIKAIAKREIVTITKASEFDKYGLNDIR